MKIALLSLLLTISTTAFSFEIEKYPTVPVSDALGTSKFSIKHFCMTSDESKLIAAVPYCEKARHIGRGYKECAVKDENKVVTIKNSFNYRWRSARGTERGFTKKFSRNLVIDVVDFDPRGGYSEKVSEFIYTIPNCN